MSDALLPSRSVPDLRKALLDHYDRTARDLPWRHRSDPYGVWVSEVMLQQTRVETVVGYYERWLERFPDVHALAEADVDDVLKAWEGLGYYRRARNLHRGACVVRETYGGQVPDSYAGLRELPGVGEYTAGAIASIAFGEVVPAVDGNVRRVFARLFDVADPKAAWLRETAGGLVDPQRPGDWNQALMELGATVCTPSKPRCASCPVAQWCGARAAGTQAERPQPPKRKAVPASSFATAVVVDAEDRLLVVRRPEQGLLAGMWSFPDGDLEGSAAVHRTGDEDEGERQGEGEGERAARGPRGIELAPAREVARALEVARTLGVTAGEEAPRPLESVRHRFTHLDATYHPVLVRGAGSPTADHRWLDAEELEEIALPVAQQKIAAAALRLLKGD